MQRSPHTRAPTAPARRRAPPDQANDLDAASKRLKDRCAGLLAGAKKYRCDVSLRCSSALTLPRRDGGVPPCQTTPDH